MRARVLAMAVAAVLACCGAAHAQDGNPAQLKKMYEDALAQLKASQDRKTELATQNEQLTAKVEELKKEVELLRGQVTELQRQDAASAERSFSLRSHHAAWQSFIERYPELRSRWRLFLDNDLLTTPAEVPDLLDPDWPLSLNATSLRSRAVNRDAASTGGDEPAESTKGP